MLDGREIVAGADLVVSAGGTMNREAAVLGVPAYSVYAGAPSAVDGWLAESGRLRVIRTEEDLDSVAVEKRTPGDVSAQCNALLLDEFVSRLLGLARAR